MRMMMMMMMMMWMMVVVMVTMMCLDASTEHAAVALAPQAAHLQPIRRQRIGPSTGRRENDT